MDVFVAGATGATGRLLVRELLDRGHEVRAVVRSAERLPESVRGHERLRVTEASLLDLSDEDMREFVEGCDAVASCLGHNLNLKGMYGKPRRLVTDAARRLCSAVRADRRDQPAKYVLMNTTGNRNRDLDEQVALGSRVVVGVLRVVLPPQADNEQAAEYLRAEVGDEDEAIEWVAVRRGSLPHQGPGLQCRQDQPHQRRPLHGRADHRRPHVEHVEGPDACDLQQGLVVEEQRSVPARLLRLRI
jgi:NAD(P)-dependent dehydrogenase (short-subunit alcohol dehydrogenase family)